MYYYLSVRCFAIMNVVQPFELARDHLMIKDWHGVCARVHPCSITKPKGPSFVLQASPVYITSRGPWCLVLA